MKNFAISTEMKLVQAVEKLYELDYHPCDMCGEWLHETELYFPADYGDTLCEECREVS